MSADAALRFLALLIFFSLILFSDQQDDQQALLRFRRLITADPHRFLRNWNPTNAHFCNWTGVICNIEHERVAALNLTGMDLQGSLSPFLANLSSLQTLNLSSNEFHGTIPRDLFSLQGLKIINLAKNRFNGTLPSPVANLSALAVLDLSENSFSGPIPAELGNLHSLQVLDLSQNQFTGRVPSSLSNMSSLLDLSLYQNCLTGHLPWDFGAKLGKLQKLMLWENQLTGNIPKNVGNISGLVMFIVSTNNLTGSIPVELGMLSSLTRLKLQRNQLDSYADPENSFITALTNCSSLEQLSLGNNRLSGRLPESIGKLSGNLQLLEMTQNRFEGDIPHQIGNLTGLNFLALNWNFFNGSIPLQLQSLKQLERLQLQHNQLGGKIPEEVAELSNLGILDLSDNMLSGQIPSALASLTQLRQLILHNNRLSGSIPPSLEYCINLELLDLSYNQLSGAIPREIGKLSFMQLYVNFSSNLLEGRLPAEFSNMIMVQAIDVSMNRMTGHIPYQIGSCSELQYLNLSGNHFDGPIPKEIGKLKSLVNLDLSSNRLSGTIPIAELTGLTLLSYLNLSSNRLTGKIQERDFNNTQILIDLQKNPDLCGPEQFKIPACPESNHHHKLLLILLPLIVGIALMCLIILICWQRSRKQSGLTESFHNLQGQEISPEEISSATNGFSENNLLGRGSYGSVYKGVLGDGRIVGIKVISCLNDEIKRSFIAECKVLSSVRHRNLVKLIGFCSTPNFKCLLSEFMSNGSLEDHLYSGSRTNSGMDECRLGIKTRLNIAVDVAHALEYLHNDSFDTVVHCDIKPGNVLLDHDMTAHLADFGISRLLNVPSADSLASTVAMRGTMGYIAPEYGLGGRVSLEGDVYSFGILLLEIFTRRRPTSEMFVGNLNLHRWVKRAFPSRIHEILDASLLKGSDRNEELECLVGLLQVGLMCSEETPQARPTVRNVSKILETLRRQLIN